ncbi:MAG: hypothetical protein ACLRT5_02995 [Lachnospiraceae bacterium]
MLNYENSIWQMMDSDSSDHIDEGSSRFGISTVLQELRHPFIQVEYSHAMGNGVFARRMRMHKYEAVDAITMKNHEARNRTTTI